MPAHIFGTEYRQRKSGLLVPATKERPKGLDLFAGCGGFSLGMIQAGWEVVGACESEAITAVTYLTNLGAYPCQFWWVEPEDEARMEKELRRCFKADAKSKLALPFQSGSARGDWTEEEYAGGDPFPGVRNFFFGDVRKLTGKKILDAIGMEQGDLDCVFGGPPCQGFSTSGKRDVMDPRNSLVFDFCRLVCELQPKMLVMENVPGIVSMVTPQGIPVLDACCRILADGGMGTFEGLQRTLSEKPNRKAALRGQSNGKYGKGRRPKAKVATDGLFDGLGEEE